MALITILHQRTMERNRVHGQVDATYTIFESEEGKKYLQIDTYGSPGRAIPGKVSQSIQLDRESLKQLKAIISEHFG